MAFVSEDLDVINQAIASGEMNVEYSDHKVTYRTMGELFRAKAHITKELRAQTGRRRPVGYRVSVSKGL